MADEYTPARQTAGDTASVGSDRAGRPARRATRSRPAATTAPPPTHEPAESTAPTAQPKEAGPPPPTVRIPVPNLPAIAVRAPLAGLSLAAGLIRANLPARDRLVYYGGLGVLAVTGVLEAPVAAAIGAGVWVATHTRNAAQQTAGAREALGEPAPPVAAT